MYRLFLSIVILTCAIFLTACVEESNAYGYGEPSQGGQSGGVGSGPGGSENEDKFSEKEYNLFSQGYQTDIPYAKILTAYNQEAFNNIWLTIPTISGDTPYPDFEVNQAVVILTEITVCSILEVTSVEENSYTTLITITQVYNIEPALCDPSPEGFYRYEYAMIEFERDFKPVSVLFKERDDY
ncbi:hypothetical protein ACJJI5_04950 [Microbulbifer sp. EKSA008]|uniref:hypothetical protein n=1 Tax=Microbulbifer sp. EKSA008 TaxID=3243367 RepID=UPI00404184A0